MNSLPYLDIHTHRRLPLEASVSVESLSVEEILDGKSLKDHATAGIHPWWLEDYTLEEINHLKRQVEELVIQGALWGVGETGLDRSMPDIIEVQKELFLWHLNLAQKHGLPLVLHNVRAGSDFLEIMKTKKPTTPWIFHDFRGSEQLIQELLRLHSDCYFSFGLSLDNSPQVREIFPTVPLENLFLETDNQKHLDIHDIYIRASEQLQIDVELLKAQIWHNFKKVSRSVQ